MRKLFLDDTRNSPDNDWDVVRSYDEFVEYIETNGVPEIISFDHDLGEEHYRHYLNSCYSGCDIPYDQFEEKTGYDCAKWLVEVYKRLPEFYRVHSMNPVGALNIKFVMTAAYKHQAEEDTNQEHVDPHSHYIQ